MKIQSSRFAEIETNEGNIITFTSPFIGFEGYNKYILIDYPKMSPILWLQSVDNPALSFPVIDPLLIKKDYIVEVPPETVEDLHLENQEEAVIYTTVVIPEKIDEIRTNLKAPIIYNPKRHLAKQIVLAETDYPVQYYFLKDKNMPKTEEQDAGIDQKGK